MGVLWRQTVAEASKKTASSKPIRVRLANLNAGYRYGTRRGSERGRRSGDQKGRIPGLSDRLCHDDDIGVGQGSVIGEGGEVHAGTGIAMRIIGEVAGRLVIDDEVARRARRPFGEVARGELAF